ncbi:hypothetical protein JCM10212_006935 [Sporobolomyces blumeae]
MLGSRTTRLLTSTPKLARTASTASSGAPRRPASSWTPRPRPATPAARNATATSPSPAPAPVKPATPVAPAQAIGSSSTSTVASSPPPAPSPSPSQPASAISDSLDQAPPSNDSFASYAASTSLPEIVSSIANAEKHAEIDWQTSFHGMSAVPFTERQAEILMRPLEAHEIEIKPDGLIYLPEILYRRILNKAFGPGGWGMVPRGEMTVMKGMVTREWGLIAGGRLVSVARGEQTFFDPSGLPTATEGCKSNALMRCCKDLGIASELWDPSFIRAYKAQHCVEAWTEHVVSKRKQKRWRKKVNKFDYPYTEARI